MRISKTFWVGQFKSLFPARTGAWALIGKDIVQTLRRCDARSVISWLVLFSTGLGMLITPDWGTRIWVFVVWGLLIGQVCSKRFSSDLKLWVIFRQLPISSREMMLAEIINPVIGATLLSWLAYGASKLIGYDPRLPIAVLAPGIILCMALAAEYDIVRQIKIDSLMAGDIPEMGVIGLILGLILAGLPLMLVMLIFNVENMGISPWVFASFGLLLSLMIAYGLWHLITSKFKQIC